MASHGIPDGIPHEGIFGFGYSTGYAMGRARGFTMGPWAEQCDTPWENSSVSCAFQTREKKVPTGAPTLKHSSTDIFRHRT